MPQRFCVNCNGWRDSWYDTCGERCGNDCRERCRTCNRFFETGELVRVDRDQVARHNAQALTSVATALAQEANRSGGRVAVSGTAYETNITYYPPDKT